MDKEKTKRFIKKWEQIDQEVKKQKKNENIPILCGDGQTVLFYLWLGGKLKSIWYGDNPAGSLVSKTVEKRNILPMIISDSEKNYIKHMIVDAENIDSALIWLHKINEISYPYPFLVEHPYFIPENVIDVFLEEEYRIPKSAAKDVLKLCPSEEPWFLLHHGTRSMLFPVWIIEEGILRYKKSYHYEEIKPREVKKGYKIENICFSKKFEKQLDRICGSLRLPFTKETVTLETLQEYLSVDNLYYVNGLGETGIRDFLKELEQNGITLKEKGRYNLSVNVVNPLGISKEELLDMDVSSAEWDYFGKEARHVVHYCLLSMFRDRYSDKVKMKELLEELTMEKLNGIKWMRKNYIPYFIEELGLAGITIPEM